MFSSYNWYKWSRLWDFYVLWISSIKKGILYIVINNFFKNFTFNITEARWCPNLPSYLPNNFSNRLIFFKIFVSLKVEYFLISLYRTTLLQKVYIYYSLKWQRSPCPLNITYTFNNLLLWTDPLANVPQSGTIQYSHLTSLSVV